MYKLSKSFSQFINQKEVRENSEDYLNEILKSLNDGFDLNKFNLILQRFGITKIEDIKFESINFLIDYANFILTDDIISEDELQDFSILKRIFRIKKGDFMELKNFEVQEILKKEFIRIYSDNFINQKQELLNLNLQSLFDLSYDEFEKIKSEEVIHALIQGADPKDLDIAKIPKGFSL